MTHHNKRYYERVDTKRSWRGYAVLALIVFTLLPLRSSAAPSAANLETKVETQGAALSLISDTSVSVGGALRFGGKNIPSQLKIMSLGDSITVGVTSPNVAFGSYRTKLWQLLTSAGMNIDYVGGGSSGPAELPDHDHEGYSGIWIKDDRIMPGYSLYEKVIQSLNTYDPDLVLLHIGTNDLNNGDSSVLSARKLDELLARIYTTKPDVHLVLALIIQPRTPSKVWQDYNKLATEVANSYAARGYHISTADMSNTLLKSDYADRLHPAKSGYDKMAEAWYPAIQTMLSNW